MNNYTAPPLDTRFDKEAFIEKTKSYFTPTSLFQFGIALLSGVLISLTWTATAHVTRLNTTFFFPLAIQYLLASVVVFVLPLILHQELLRVSLKSMQAALTLAVIFYFIPGLIFFRALRDVSPILGAMAAGMAPLMLWMFGVGHGRHRFIYLLLGLSAITLFFLGNSVDTPLDFDKAQLVGMMVGATVMYSIGLALCKRVFWIHKAQDLTCFAMFFAGLMFLVLAILFGEEPMPAEHAREFQVWIFCLGALVTGLGAHAYRYIAIHSSRMMTLLITMMIPVGAYLSARYLGFGAFDWNVYRLGGAGLYLLVMVFACWTELPTYWMANHFNNTRRKGDRINCKLPGYIKLPSGPLGRLELSDISVGGLGFKCDTLFQVADDVIITFPLGQNWTQVSMEARVVYFSKSKDPELPWAGGVEFVQLKDDGIIQILVEIIAYLSTETT